MKKLFLVAGARPNFMKIAPLCRALRSTAGLRGVVVHTGQHYDYAMAESFFTSLGIGKPDFNLEVGSGSHAVQTAQIMIRFEELCLREKPDCVIVVGDVNSTVAAGLVAKKLRIDLAHVEAGLRSRDRSMPEEINRIATDAITDLFFTTEKEGTENLIAEGHDASKIHFVGHVMIDTLLYQLSKMGNRPPSDLAKSIKCLLPQKYICMTLHRPSNVDTAETLRRVLDAVSKLAEKAPVIFPCHPRTLKNIHAFGFERLTPPLPDSRRILEKGMYRTEPLGYDDFLYLWKDACLVLTDSGGMQEETTALKIPCITMRETTERPVTVEIGSNVVTGTDAEKIIQSGLKAVAGEWKDSGIPELWDGKASERIVEALKAIYCR